MGKLKSGLWLFIFFLFIFSLAGSFIWLNLRLWPAVAAGQATPVLAFLFSSLMLLYLAQCLFYVAKSPEGLLLPYDPQSPFWKAAREKARAAGLSPIKNLLAAPGAAAWIGWPGGLLFLPKPQGNILFLGRRLLEMLSLQGLEALWERLFKPGPGLTGRMAFLLNARGPLDVLFKKIAEAGERGGRFSLWLSRFFSLPYFLMGPARILVRLWGGLFAGLALRAKAEPEDGSLTYLMDAIFSLDGQWAELEKRRAAFADPAYGLWDERAASWLASGPADCAGRALGPEVWETVEREMERHWPSAPKAGGPARPGQREDPRYGGFYYQRRASAMAPWPVKETPGCGVAARYGPEVKKALESLAVLESRRRRLADFLLETGKFNFFSGRSISGEDLAAEAAELEYGIFSLKRKLGLYFSHLCVWERSLKPAEGPGRFWLDFLYQKLFQVEGQIQALARLQGDFHLLEEDEARFLKFWDFLQQVETGLKPLAAEGPLDLWAPLGRAAQEALLFFENNGPGEGLPGRLASLEASLENLADNILELVLSAWEGDASFTDPPAEGLGEGPPTARPLAVFRGATHKKKAPRDIWGPEAVKGFFSLLLLAVFLWQGSTLGLSRVYVYNGLGTTVTVRLGTEDLTLAPLFYGSVKLLPGAVYEARAVSQDGRLIESFRQKLAQRPGLELYNIAGAAPLQEWRARFGPGKGALQVLDKRFLGAPRWLAASADLVLEDLPRNKDKGELSVLSAYGELEPQKMLKLFGPAERARLITLHKRWTDPQNLAHEAWLEAR